MNGTDHYEAAERLLSQALMVRSKTDATPVDPGAAHLVAAAQVHATLALAAATALPMVTQYVGDNEAITSWAQAIAPARLTEPICHDGCEDEGRDGCHGICNDRRAAKPIIDEEPPF